MLPQTVSLSSSYRQANMFCPGRPLLQSAVVRFGKYRIQSWEWRIAHSTFQSICCFSSFGHLWTQLKEKVDKLKVQANRITTFSCAYTVQIARKSLKIDDFLKTGSRNMAETWAINFLTSVSYSTSIVTGGLRRLLIPVLMWDGVDFENSGNFIVF